MAMQNNKRQNNKREDVLRPPFCTLRGFSAIDAVDEGRRALARPASVTSPRLPDFKPAAPEAFTAQRKPSRPVTLCGVARRANDDVPLSLTSPPLAPAAAARAVGT